MRGFTRDRAPGRKVLQVHAFARGRFRAFLGSPGTADCRRLPCPHEGLQGADKCISVHIAGAARCEKKRGFCELLDKRSEL